MLIIFVLDKSFFFIRVFFIVFQVKKYAHKEPTRKGPQSRDVKRANDLKVPFSVHDIIHSPVETFNEMLTKHKLTEPQV